MPALYMVVWFLGTMSTKFPFCGAVIPRLHWDVCMRTTPLTLTKSCDLAHWSVRAIPCLMVISVTKYQEDFESSVDSFNVSLFILIALSFIPAAWMAFIVREKETKCKHQQVNCLFLVAFRCAFVVFYLVFLFCCFLFIVSFYCLCCCFTRCFYFIVSFYCFCCCFTRCFYFLVSFSCFFVVSLVHSLSIVIQ